jgi:lipopolysaccharide biosynthesis glycosyltransferase
MSSMTIQVAACVDRGFTVPLAAALASLDEASGEDSVVVHVLHPGLSETIRDRVTAGLSAIDVEWHTVDDRAVAGAFYSTRLTSASLYRLLLGRLLPADVTRVLYLDADVVVRSSLAPVYASDLKGHVVGAVRDAGSPWAASSYGPDWRQLGLAPESAYFNSGVLLIDLERWREETVGERCLQLLRSGNPRWGDQDALNVVLQGRWIELERRWNLQTADIGDYSVAWAHWASDIEAANNDPAVIHYTEHDKPWIGGSQHPLAAEWFQALDQTAWAGWRPRPPLEFRLGSRLWGALRYRYLQRRNRLPE